MLRNLRRLTGRPVAAEDGGLGDVRGFFFDDMQWAVRYFIVETRSRGCAKEVILSTASFKQEDWDSDHLRTDLSLGQVLNGPEVDLSKPLGVEHEERIARYFGWPQYWRARGAEVRHLAATPGGARTVVAEKESATHSLRSTREIMGFTVKAIDGEAGKAGDLVADDVSWQVHYLEIDAVTSWIGKRVLIAPEWVESIDWQNGLVHVPLSASTIRYSPEYDPSVPISRQYEDKLYDYYKMPKYWRRY
ncbi:MAG: hypothetical protein ACYC5N_03740 [Endomicrobiales bacterium]